MKKSILFILLFILFPFYTSAQELELILECPKDINEWEEFKCQLKGSSNFIVSALEYEFEVPSNVTYQRFEKDNTWEGDEEDNLILLYTDENKTGIFPIGEMYFVANENIKELKLDTLYLLFCDEEFNDHLVVKKEEDNVKEVKREEKKEVNKKSYIILCVIIIIIGAVAFLVFLRRKRK